ncbi:response regulator transcription factor [Crocinitomicaceae bacterium CZZ-1]|uniref:Phosphate regulon transcriptional regulatory protein PhoB n=1 Tax=Taishania pollutisoli TaxID=2766479 RepID=A0A8J6P5F9_9FLAO|nr:response regulator transcription factor [Taishania pollutisoli]MBC9812169.1 response regulator transcription factor [Taishania pollutisoli]MBX2950591.1 response regulator transcription factor [Crocinitomicaceae bacterium]NGF74670.1 response regulator transcription factor [Fluviicola sp. SGL-29]
MKILIIDDEDDIREILKYNLSKEGYETFDANNGESGLKKCIEINPDLVLLDIMMPGMDGIEVCETIRKTPGLENVLICFLTARGEDYSQIAGLDAGADDFVAKPIKPKVLISRINAILRRKSGESKSYSEGLVINRERYHVELNGQVIQLPRKEFELLALLASKPGTVFEREVILDSVWGSEIVVGDRTIDVHIRKLREKIGSDYIVTIKGIGYKYQEKE